MKGIWYKKRLLYAAQQKNGTWAIFFIGRKGKEIKFVNTNAPFICREYATEAEAENALYVFVADIRRKPKRKKP